MKALYDLKEKLCGELEEIARKGEIGAGDLELIHKLTDSVKNIDKICMLEEGGGYSQDGGYSMDGYSRDGYSRDGYSRDGYSRDGYSQDGSWRANIEGRYDRDSSYARRGRHWVRGHYSRDGYDGGNSRDRGYSRDGAREQLERMMEEARDPQERETYRRALESMR